MKEKNTKKINSTEKKWTKVGDKLKDAKIAKTVQIDADVFLWLRKEAGRTGIPYQTLLNAKLRESMQLPDRVRVLVEEILSHKKAS
jgi:hypothetical protein